MAKDYSKSGFGKYSQKDYSNSGFNKTQSSSNTDSRNGLIAQKLAKNNPYMQYDVDAMQEAYDKLVAQRDETGSKEYDDAISKKGAELNVVKREQQRSAYETEALNSSDFDYYSNIGANIQNPTSKEANGWLSFGSPFGNNKEVFHLGGKSVGNIVTYSRDNYDTLKTYNVEEADYEDERESPKLNVGDEKYHFMSDGEVSVYNYYLAKENEGLVDSGTAQAYLDSIDDTLNRRVAKDMGTYIGDNEYLADVFALTANTESAFEDMGNIMKVATGKEITSINPSATKYAAAEANEKLADKGTKILGKSTAQIKNDLIGTTAYMMPSLIVGTAGSLIPGVGEVVGATAMGSAVAGGAYKDMLYQGYSEDVAKKYATMSGIKETGFQLLLGGIKVFSGGKAVGDIVKKFTGKEIASITSGIQNVYLRALADYGIDIFKEGLEESVQEALEPIIKAKATGENIDIDENYVSNILYSGLLGGLSAGVLNSPNLAYNLTNPNVNINNTNGQTPNNDTSTEEATEETNEVKETPLLVKKGKDKPTNDTDYGVINLYDKQAEPDASSPFTDDGNIDVEEETKAPISDVETSIENADKDLKEQIKSLGLDDEANTVLEKGYDPELGISVSEYVTGIKEGYKYGYSNYPVKDIKADSSFNSLTKSVQEYAYNLGNKAGHSNAVTNDKARKALANGKTGKPEGVVKSQGVSLAKLKEAFNKNQDISYKFMSAWSDFTGMDVILYRSEPNASGRFTANQGCFTKKDNKTLYIDVNAGLRSKNDLENKERNLALYTMLRTFSHEATHFGQYWNPIEYRSFKRVVFETLNERGENAEDLIDDLALNEGYSFDKASDEVVADAMTDILGDERTAQKFAENLAKKDKNLLQKFIDALKKFISRVKEYFNSLVKNPSKAANALKEEVDGEIRYLDNILDGWVKLMSGAVENMQKAYAVDETTTEVKATEETKTEPTVKEEVKEASNEDTRVKELLDNAKKILEENGSTAVKIKLLDVPHEKSLQEKNAIKTAEKFNYVLSVNSLALLSNDLQIDYSDTVNVGWGGLWIIKTSSDWNGLDADMKKHHDYLMEHYVDGEVNKGRLPKKDSSEDLPFMKESSDETTAKNVKSLTDYAKVLSKGKSEETNWYKTVTDPAVYGPYVKNPIPYIKAAKGYYQLGLYGESFDYKIDRNDFWSYFYAFHEGGISLSEETAKKIYEAGAKDREALTESAYTDEAPIHLGDNKSVFERVIEPFYHLIGVSEHSKTYGEDGMLPYNLVDIADHGNDLYVRFRDMPSKYNGRGFDIKLADFKNYTAQEIIGSVDKAYGKDSLGTNFTNGIKDYYKQFVKSEKPKKESKPAKTVEKSEPKVEVVEKPNAVTGDIDFKATKAIAEKIVKQTKKTDRTVGMASDGYYFIGNTAITVMVDEATYKEFEESERGLSLKSTNTRPFVEYGKLATTKLGGKAYKYITSDNVKSFYFEDGNTKYLVNEKFIKAFSGYDFYYVPNDFKLAVKDSNGNFIGIVCSMKISKEINTEKLELAKIKGFNQETPKLDTEVAAEEETVEPNVDDTSYEEIEDTSSKYPGTSPSDKTANALIDTYLSKGQKFTSNDLYKICDETFGGTQAEGKYDRKDAYDAMELAVNKRIVEVMKGYNTGKVDNALEGLRRMQALLDLLPTQTVRTEEQEQYQQFSTPPNIAYLASWVANINSKDHMMEPSAGIGGIASFAKSWGAMITVNELSKRRYGVLKAMGFDNMFNENAEHINNILPDSIQPSVVVMNPPFSSTAGRTKTNKTSNAELHINSAIDRLGEGGRLVAILGRGMADDKYSKYWNKIRENYTIRANISIDGSNYKKYGTTFDIQLVVIDKIGPQKGKTFTAVYEDLSKVPSALEGIRNERSTEVKFSTIVASNQGDSVPAERDGVVSVSMDSSGNSNDGSGALSNGTKQRDTGESGNNNLQPGVSDGVSEHNQLTDTQHKGNDKSDTENSVSKDRESDSETGSEVTGNDSGESSDERSGLGDDSTRSTEVGRSKERNDDGVFADYVMPKLPIKGSKPHPATLVESSAMSSVEMPPAIYKTHLPENVIKNNLSAEQMVTITYAGQSHEQKLPNGTRKGFFIGDGTGVGKGRQISGIILDNFEQGRKRAIWVSKNDKLYSDAVRDWTETTGRSAKEVYNFGKIKLGDKIDIKEGILFTTYSTIANEKGEKSRLNQIVDWLGKDFDGVIAFDEAHNMANAGSNSGAWGKKEGAAKALKSIELQNKLPNARVVYVSATGATEVSNLAYAERLGLWGEGTAFPNRNDFISKIGSAGLSAMELVVRDMKAMGVYVARSISYNGVSYDTVEHNLDGIQTEIYNTMCRAWQSVMDNVLKSLEETNANKNSNARKQARGQFYGAMQRFYNQVLTSMSMPSVIKDINNQLADGKSVVIQLVNTNQAQADREIANIKAENGSLDDMDLTPRGQLIEYLNNCFPVNLYEDVTDENGNTTSRLVKDSQGNPVVDKRAVKRRDELIALVNDMSIPDGPLEMLFDVFGTENVAEVTGRSRRVVPKKMENGSVHRVEESRTKAHTEADVAAFNEGKKRILVFSDAGGTGKSYHASRTVKNQQQRVHYVLQPGWSASNAVQGFGRTNRSNQSSAPIYKLVTTNIKGQKRFTSTIARRLDQLGALTKGQRDSGSGMFGAKDNLETDLAKDALREFYSRLIRNKIPGLDRYDIIKKLGLLNKFTDQYGSFGLDDSAARDMGLFLNRILSLEVDEQNRVFDEFTNIYDFMLEKAIQEGTLDTGMENVKADKIEIIDSEVISKQKGTGAETKYVQAKVYTKPRVLKSIGDVKDYRSGFVGIYKTENEEYKAVYRIADKTTQFGDVQKQYLVYGPNLAKHSVWIENTLNAKATLVPEKEWNTVWAEEVKNVPEYNEEIKHMLTGALLPIWDRLPSEGNTKVQRITADNGESYLGRIIEPNIIDGILRVFGASKTNETFTVDSVKNGALNEGKIYNLTYNNAKIKRSRVSNEWRLEYIQPKNQFAILSTYPGMIREKISWQDRFFIPQNEQGEKIISKILENNPVSYVGDEDTQYQSRAYLTETDSEGRELSEGQIKFFGRSEIRDKNNNLLRVFHGTSKKFTVFDTSLSGFKNGAVLGRGIYLTDNKNDAFDWGGGSRVIEAYANITNPLYADERLDNIISERLHDVFPVSLFEDYTRYDGVKVTAKESQENLINKVLSGTNGDFIHEVMLKYSNGDKYNYDKSTDLLMEYGYDGIVKKHGRDLEVVAFDSNQVKEITNLNPTENDDIQYQSRNDETFTNTEVLEIAAEKVEAMNLTDGEKFAIETFKKNLTELDNLEAERKELGRLYKEQQFGKSVDKDKATETLNRMHILDEKIKKTEEALLSLEEKEVLKRVLEKARKVIEAEDRKKSQEMLKRYRERKKNSESIKKYRDRIKEDVEELSKWITKPDVKAGKMVPDAIRNTVIDFLASIDFTSKRQLKGGDATKADAEFIKRIEKLNDAIKENFDLYGEYSGFNDLPENFLKDMQGFIDNARKLTEQHDGEYVINKMTAAELKELSDLVRIIKSFVNKVNSFHKNSMFKHVEDCDQDTLAYLSRCGKAEGANELSTFIYWDNMRPAFAMWDRFGAGGRSILKELIEGQGQLAFNAETVKDFTNGNKDKGIVAAYTEAEVKEWTEKGETFTFGRDKVFIPYAWIMGIYELSKQEDSLVHMLSDKGGIRIATFTTKDKVKYSDDGHLLDKARLEEIIGKLSPRQKEVADKLQQFMEKVGGPWGNYVSVARFGIELFTKPHYYPINSDGRHLNNNIDEAPNNASLYALLNMSFTKDRVEGADNRIVIYSIFDVFANHMASMAQYNALALPVLDALKWFNYKEVTKDEVTGKYIVGKSLKEELAKVYGVPEEKSPGKGSEGYAVTFFKNILKAFNGTETQGTPQDAYGLKLLHQHNMAQIAYNLRVVVQQPMSILRAGLVLDYSSIMKGMQMTPNEAKETLRELNEHNGIAVWKNVLGFYDTNISRGLTALIKHDKTTLDKVNEFGLIGAEYADKVTWAAMWKACKIEVMKNGTKESDPKFFNEVNDLFNEVIYKTQVVDSVLTKTEFMRSKGYWARAMSSFMSEAVTTASALADAMFKYNMDIQRGMSRSQAWVRNKDNITRTMIAYAISAIVLAAVQAVIDGFRDDDDEAYFKKWADAFIGNVIDELMPFNKLPIFSDLYEAAKELLSILGVDTYGNPPTSIFIQCWDSIFKGFSIIKEKIEGSNKGYTWYGGIKKLLQAASSITGAPLGNVTREAVIFWNTTAGSLNENLKIKSYESGNHDMNKYFRAVDDNDFAKANNLYNEMVKENKKTLAEKREKEGKLELSDEELEKEVKSNIKSSITTHYKSLYVEAYQSKDDKTMAEIRQKLYKTGLYGSVDDVIKACNKWLNDYK